MDHFIRICVWVTPVEGEWRSIKVLAENPHLSFNSSLQKQRLRVIAESPNRWVSRKTSSKTTVWWLHILIIWKKQASMRELKHSSRLFVASKTQPNCLRAYLCWFAANLKTKPSAKNLQSVWSAGGAKYGCNHKLKTLLLKVYWFQFRPQYIVEQTNHRHLNQLKDCGASEVKLLHASSLFKSNAKSPLKRLARLLADGEFSSLQRIPMRSTS